MSQLISLNMPKKYLNSQILVERSNKGSVYGVSFISFMLVMAQNLKNHLDKKIKFNLEFLSNHGRNAYADEKNGKYFIEYIVTRIGKIM